MGRKTTLPPVGVPAAMVHCRGLGVMSAPGGLKRVAWGPIVGTVLVTAMVVGSVFGLSRAIVSVKPTTLSAESSAQQYGSDIRQLEASIATLEDGQVKNEVSVVSGATLQQRLSAIRIDASVHSSNTAAEITQLKHDLDNWQQALTGQLALAAAMTAGASGALNVPIILYHTTPADFDRQLSTLEQRGYTTITMAELTAALVDHATLPAKPVVLTFDDGLQDQMTAFHLLQAHHMKATYYIINDGPIINTPAAATINRPHNVGGWEYLSWDEIRELDKSGIIEIGAHTMDHLPLANQSPEIQHFEIFESKAELEAELGHPVTTFAYPYGSYNASVANLVRQAGFTSAVTTLPGTLHTLSTIFTLTRIRDVYGLP